MGSLKAGFTGDRILLHGNAKSARELEAAVDVGARIVVDNFDEMLQQSKEQPLVYGVSIHAFIVGQPFRLRHFRRAMEHVRAASKEVWFATTGQIARHYAQAVPAP